MKYFAEIKKAVVGAIGFAVIFLTSLDVTNIPSKYVPTFNLLVGLATTYSVWKVTNANKSVHNA